MKKIAKRSAEDMMSLYVVFLRALYQIHQNNHWKAIDYGHHLLFERLYNLVKDLVDESAEKTIGLFGNLSKQDKVSSIAAQFSPDKFKDNEAVSCLLSSLSAEKAFQKYATHVYNTLKDSNMTLGLDDMIMSHVNKSELHTYLLQQALKGLGVEPNEKKPEEPEEDEEEKDDE